MSMLSRAIRKCRHFDKRVWCGYLTPSEFVTLHHHGYILPTTDQGLRQALDAVAKGHSNSRWYYFTVIKEAEITVHKSKKSS